MNMSKRNVSAIVSVLLCCLLSSCIHNKEEKIGSCSTITGVVIDNDKSDEYTKIVLAKFEPKIISVGNFKPVCFINTDSHGFFSLKLCGLNDDSYHRLFLQGGDISLMGVVKDGKHLIIHKNMDAFPTIPDVWDTDLQCDRP